MKKLTSAAVLTSLLLLSIIISGCISEEEPKEKESWLELVGSSHKIYAADSTTYIILVTNEHDENDTITLHMVSQPSGWNVTLNQTVIVLTSRAYFGIFLTVNSSQEAKEDSYKVKIEATSELDGSKTSLTITTKIIKDTGDRAQEGNKVEVNYLGYLNDFRIFDTSVSEIGYNSAIRKTDDFNPGRSYAPLKVQVGTTDPYPSDQYINTVEGFSEAIVGMKVGQSRTVIVPPSKGYGIIENATLNATEDIPMLETMTINEFEANYPNEEPIENVSMSHHFWEWNVSIDYVNESEDVVRITHEPNLNQIISPYGWESEVIYKNQSDNGGEGSIIVEHHAQAGAKAIYRGFDGSVISVENNQIKLDYNVNTELLGSQDIIFDITLIKISD